MTLQYVHLKNQNFDLILQICKSSHARAILWYFKSLTGVINKKVVLRTIMLKGTLYELQSDNYAELLTSTQSNVIRVYYHKISY